MMMMLSCFLSWASAAVHRDMHSDEGRLDGLLLSPGFIIYLFIYLRRITICRRSLGYVVLRHHLKQNAHSQPLLICCLSSILLRNLFCGFVWLLTLSWSRQCTLCFRQVIYFLPDFSAPNWPTGHMLRNAHPHGWMQITTPTNFTGDNTIRWWIVRHHCSNRSN